MRDGHASTYLRAFKICKQSCAEVRVEWKQCEVVTTSLLLAGRREC